VTSFFHSVEACCIDKGRRNPGFIQRSVALSFRKNYSVGSVSSPSAARMVSLSPWAMDGAREVVGTRTSLIFHDLPSRIRLSNQGCRYGHPVPQFITSTLHCPIEDLQQTPKTTTPCNNITSILAPPQSTLLAPLSSFGILLPHEIGPCPVRILISIFHYVVN
jgi:hypothetical protein